MLKKYWKKIGVIILIVACIFNVMIKLINKLSIDTEMVSSAQYIQDKTEQENKQNNSKTNNKNEKNKIKSNNT